ncbi:MAG: carboxypeptidase-like regulatory domain-containing protein, partial [Muribaculaceae bacterium]|nr:carboxypeptidase-like regulatory domain-containing protein [Muribaculaceae bacterium]
MTRLLYLLLALLAAIPAVSARTIQGTVLSSSDSTAVVGANCRLMAGDKLIEGATADADGAFSLSTDSRDALTLEISMTGYSPTDILIEAGGKNINAGTVYLDEGIALGELNVTAQSVIQGKGRTIVYPSSSEVKASSTSISLFQKLPLAGLDANPINRTLTIDGGAPVILINGIPSDITDVNALQPKDIERIEYSRFTPARYADKGGKGFINIILKKRTDGGQIYAWGRSAVSTAFVDGNIRASYHQAASQFTLSYNPSWRNYQRVYDNITESYISPDYTVELKEHDRNPFYYHTHNMRLKYDYSPSSRTLFSATFSATPNYSKRTAYADSYSSVKGSYYHIDDQKSADFSPTLDLFLR